MRALLDAYHTTSGWTTPRGVGQRFSCPSDGADGEVTFMYSYCIPAVCPDAVSLDGAGPAGICVDRIPGVVSLGGALTTDLVPLKDS